MHTSDAGVTTTCKYSIEIKGKGLTVSTNDALFSEPEQRMGLTGRPLREMPDPQPLDSHGPATIISMCNQKGGVGKTTSSINLGACLAEQGRKVLLVDLDPQGALSAGLNVSHDEEQVTVYDLMGETRYAFSRTFDYQTYLWAAIFYLAIVETLRHIWAWLEARLTRHLKR